MLRKIIWPLFILIAAGFFLFLLVLPSADNGGDMVEYFGMTESLINHGSVDLTHQDYESLKHYLAAGYFKPENDDTKGGFFAYVPGRDGKTYSLHFWAYSILATPVRLVLRIFAGNELNALRLTNFLILFFALAYILKNFIREPKKQLIFLAGVFLSPLVFFITYPGVDIFYTVFLMLGVFAFFHKKYIQAGIFTAVASWHSQPLILIAVAICMYYLFASKFQLKKLFMAGMIGLVALIPYAANLYMFGVLSPWSTINDGWTTLYGFGIQNLSLKRLYEQFFDLNIGLFWYAPALLLGGLFYLIKAALKNKLSWFILGTVIATAFAYQTNPAWHYGSAGFSPTRHIIFAIPLLIYFVVEYLKINSKTLVFLSIPVIMQVFALGYNNYAAPDFYNSLFLSPYAKVVLNTFPQLYNPTPKIFVDDVTHTDKKFIETAVYKNDGVCKKAFVTTSDIHLLEKECGPLPAKYLEKLDNPYARKTNDTRSVYTIEATYWADPDSCAPNYSPPLDKPYVCMHTIEDFMHLTGVTDKSRIERLNYEGAWKIKKGDVLKINIPPGYFVDHYSLEGAYVNY